MSPASGTSDLPTVAVIVPIYNGEADLPELLACLQRQTYPADRVTYLLVDNASRDRTPELLQQAAQSQTISLKPLAETQIQSSYAARNTGIRAATAEILAFTDADCRPQPDWLARLVEPFADTAIGLVVGEVAALPGDSLLERYAERENVLTQKHTLAHPFCPYGQTANLAVRASIFAEVGLFRPYLTTGGDADICWRILKQTAWKLQFAEAAIVRHRHRATWQELQSQWQRYGRSNRYLHELHQIDLMRPITRKEIAYRLGRWLVKELPTTSGKLLLGKASTVDLVATPIGLFCARNRYLGQETASLPEQAHEIARL